MWPDAVIDVRGIVLVGGNGSRCWPASYAVSKQLLPVYDKPAAYYAVSELIYAGVNRILLICRGCDEEQYWKLFQPICSLGVDISLATQPEPRGIAEALLIADATGFLSPVSRVVLALGDNVFIPAQLSLSGVVPRLRSAIYDEQPSRGVIFTTSVADPSRYGVVRTRKGRLVDIIEKPVRPPSNTVVTGLYVYPPDAAQYASKLKPSKRGELEITDLNRQYIKRGRLNAISLPRGTEWYDTGTPSAMLSAARRVAQLQRRYEILVGSPELAAVTQGWASPAQVCSLPYSDAGTEYGELLHKSLREWQLSGAPITR